MTFAAGLATRGIKPVVAIYSTFLQRAYDNVIHDVALQQLPVVFCMDRAGLVGEDGPTHMGLYDIAYMLAVPGMVVTAPKDGTEMLALVRTGLAHTAGPLCLRYPRDASPDVPQAATEIPAVPFGTWEVLRQGQDIAILAVGHDGAARARGGRSARRRWHRSDRGQLPIPQAVRRGDAHRGGRAASARARGRGGNDRERIRRVHEHRDRRRSIRAVRVGVHGVPDRYIEQAPRKVAARARPGSTLPGIARRVRALLETEAVAG